MVNQPTSKEPPLWRRLGPGLITGASDDDPSGIATYSQVGAQYGYGFLWTMLFAFPLMAVVQEISARIGRVSGKGIAANLKLCCPSWIVHLTIAVLSLANIANLGADIGAMGSVIGLVTGHTSMIYALLCGLLALLLEIYIPYSRYVSILKWLTVSLFGYIVAALLVKTISWPHVFRNTVIPTLHWSKSSIGAMVAILGTTISPYLFFWQASEEVEEVKCHQHAHPLKENHRDARSQFKRIRFDTYAGMAVSNVVGFFIILMAAATLHIQGQLTVDSAATAAQALAPLGGRVAFWLFALGILGTGFLTIPVLAGSTAYAVSETLGWRACLEDKWSDAKPFYAILASSVFVGVALNFSGINPIRALYWSAIFNGIVAGPVLIMILIVATNKKVMGRFVIPMSLRVLGGITAFVMCAAAVALACGCA